VIVNAVFFPRRDQIHLVGVAQLNGGRQLTGLEDTIGTRSYLLDLDAEAIYVLAEFSHPSSISSTASPERDHPRPRRHQGARHDRRVHLHR
jgi:hypothetical protein